MRQRGVGPHATQIRRPRLCLVHLYGRGEWRRTRCLGKGGRPGRGEWGGTGRPGKGRGRPGRGEWGGTRRLGKGGRPGTPSCRRAKGARRRRAAVPTESQVYGRFCRETDGPLVEVGVEECPSEIDGGERGVYGHARVGAARHPTQVPMSLLGLPSHPSCGYGRGRGPGRCGSVPPMRLDGVRVSARPRVSSVSWSAAGSVPSQAPSRDRRGRVHHRFRGASARIEGRSYGALRSFLSRVWWCFRFDLLGDTFSPSVQEAAVPTARPEGRSTTPRLSFSVGGFWGVGRGARPWRARFQRFRLPPTLPGESRFRAGGPVGLARRARRAVQKGTEGTPSRPRPQPPNPSRWYPGVGLPRLALCPERPGHAGVATPRTLRRQTHPVFGICVCRVDLFINFVLPIYFRESNSSHKRLVMSFLFNVIFTNFFFFVFGVCPLSVFFWFTGYTCTFYW